MDERKPISKMNERKNQLEMMFTAKKVTNWYDFFNKLDYGDVE